MTGLSGSGKSTLAAELEKILFGSGYLVQVLDGDNIRTGISNNLAFSEQDRKENIRRVAEVARLMVGAGVITICSFISPSGAIREMAKNIIGQDDFYEIYIKATIDACESRDVKGLYKKARSGEIPNFTGIDSPYEAPLKPSLVIDTDARGVEESLTVLKEYVLKNIRL